MTPLQQIARQAVADASREQPDLNPMILAMKYTRDRGGVYLAQARDAVNWALQNPDAADLPPDSVVAFRSFSDDARHDVAIKRAGGETPWQTTNGYGGHANDYRDDEVDDLLAAGRAVVLRVGAGA
jgi:hypothetical protein